MNVFIKCASHRARDKAKSMIGDRQGFYSWTRSTGYGCMQVTWDEAQRLKASIRGITILKAPYDDLRECISFK